MRWHTNVRIGQSGIYPGLALLISSWYRRGELPSLRPYRRKANDEISEEQQLRFAYLQAGEVIILATGNIVNFGVGNFSRQNLFFLFRAPFFFKNESILYGGDICYLLESSRPNFSPALTNGLDLVEQSASSKRAKGLAMDVCGPGIGSSPPNTNAIYKPLKISQIAFVIGIITYFWIVDFPENAEQSFHFLGKEETELAVKRIEQDRGDVLAAPFSWHEVLPHFLDPKIYAFAVMFFLLVSVGFARVCIIDCSSQKKLGCRISYLPAFRTFYQQCECISSKQLLSCTSNTKMHMCSLQSGMGFSEKKAILLAAPVNLLSRTPYNYH